MLWVELGIGVAAHGTKHLMAHSSLVTFIRVEELQDLENSFVWHRENYNDSTDAAGQVLPFERKHGNGHRASKLADFFC